VEDGGTLPKEFTGDGESATPPLSGAEHRPGPRASRSSCTTWHRSDQVVLILYNIPADVKSLPKNVKGVGTLGNNSVNERTEYAPPHSKDRAKTYILTVYALSASPQITVSPERVNRDVLLGRHEGHNSCHCGPERHVLTRHAGRSRRRAGRESGD